MQHLLCSGSEQCSNGFPRRPCGQLQTGVWVMTAHIEFTPHDPRQGSAHTCPKQALSNGQSESVKHSGLHFGLYAAPGPRHGSQIAT